MTIESLGHDRIAIPLVPHAVLLSPQQRGVNGTSSLFRYSKHLGPFRQVVDKYNGALIPCKCMEQLPVPVGPQHSGRTSV
jgi:hypothetical protein